MAHWYRNLFDTFSAEHDRSSVKERAKEFEDLVKDGTFKEEFNSFKTWYSDRKDILRNLGNALFNLALDYLETKKDVSRDYARQFISRKYNLSSDSTKQLSHEEVIRILENIVIDLDT